MKAADRPPHTEESLGRDLAALGVAPDAVLMVHASLREVGQVLGGPQTVVRVLLRLIGPEGTLVMPAFSPAGADPAQWWNRPPVPEVQRDVIRAHMPVFDAATTPSEMGAVSEAFRTWPGTRRSDHPTGSLCARGPQAALLVDTHPLAMHEGPGTPYERLVALGAVVLLLGVGFESCTLMHHAESLSCSPRRQMLRTLHLEDGWRVWHESAQMGIDGGLHFPRIGEAFVATGGARRGKVGDSVATLAPVRALVAHATAAFDRIFADGVSEPQ